MRRILQIIISTTLFGCASTNATQRAMTSATVTAKFVDGAYHQYSGELDSRLQRCDPAVAPSSSVRTQRDLDACLGRGFKRPDHERIGDALRAYELAARSMEAVLISKTPGSNPEAQNEAYRNLIRAALALLATLPEGSKLATQLERLITS